MASLDFNGLDAQMQRLSRLGKSIEPAAKKGIKAGAKVIVAALKEAAPRDPGGRADRRLEQQDPPGRHQPEGRALREDRQYFGVRLERWDPP